MRLHISEWTWACIDAACLLGMALFVVFGINPGGFEGQGVWYLLLLPGSLPAWVLSDYVSKLAPSVEPVINWVLIISFNFGWYWGISYAIIKLFRRGDSDRSNYSCVSIRAEWSRYQRSMPPYGGSSPSRR
jgi:hypothetical protein